MITLKITESLAGQTPAAASESLNERSRMGPSTPANPSSQPPATPPSAILPRVAFTVRETAAMLGICEKSVRRLVARGLLRPSRALRHLLIPKHEIDRFLKETVSL